MHLKLNLGLLFSIFSAQSCFQDNKRGPEVNSTNDNQFMADGGAGGETHVDKLPRGSVPSEINLGTVIVKELNPKAQISIGQWVATNNFSEFTDRFSLLPNVEFSMGDTTAIPTITGEVILELPEGKFFREYPGTGGNGMWEKGCGGQVTTSFFSTTECLINDKGENCSPWKTSGEVIDTLKALVIKKCPNYFLDDRGTPLQPKLIELLNRQSTQQALTDFSAKKYEEFGHPQIISNQLSETGKRVSDISNKQASNVHDAISKLTQALDEYKKIIDDLNSQIQKCDNIDDLKQECDALKKQIAHWKQKSDDAEKDRDRLKGIIGDFEEIQREAERAEQRQSTFDRITGLLCSFVVKYATIRFLSGSILPAETEWMVSTTANGLCSLAMFGWYVSSPSLGTRDALANALLVFAASSLGSAVAAGTEWTQICGPDLPLCPLATLLYNINLGFNIGYLALVMPIAFFKSLKLGLGPEKKVPSKDGGSGGSPSGGMPPGP